MIPVMLFMLVILTYGLPVLFLLATYLGEGAGQYREKFVFIVLSMACSALSVNGIKYLIDRPRPFVVYPFLEKLASGGSPSFPSGHAADAFALATALSIVFPGKRVIISAYLLACLIGYSRMALGVHYLSDVLAGAFTGAASAYMFGCLLSPCACRTFVRVGFVSPGKNMMNKIRSFFRS